MLLSTNNSKISFFKSHILSFVMLHTVPWKDLKSLFEMNTVFITVCFGLHFCWNHLACWSTTISNFSTFSLLLTLFRIFVVVCCYFGLPNVNMQKSSSHSQIVKEYEFPINFILSLDLFSIFFYFVKLFLFLHYWSLNI